MKAIDYQQKSLALYPSSISKFFVAKYFIRINLSPHSFQSDISSYAFIYLNQAVDESPFLAMGLLKEIDFINDERVLKFLEGKNVEINEKIGQLIDDWESFNGSNVNKIKQRLIELQSKPYDVKVTEQDAEKWSAIIINKLLKYETKI